MKKQKPIVISILLIIVLSSIFIFTSCDDGNFTPSTECVNHVDSDNNGICDNCGDVLENTTCTEHVDSNDDRICDNCGEVVYTHTHKDLNKDNSCDKCGATVTQATCTEHIDNNNNGICDKCSTALYDYCDHKDADNDGVCDLCNLSIVVSLDFYAINDIHGTLAQTDSNDGVGGLTTYLLDKQKNGNAFVLSSGDTWQGGTESNNTKGKLATEWLDYINCVSMTLGNHEFDWTTSAIKLNAQIASFPILAINVYERSTNERATYCDASIMLEYDGAKIGIIGAIGDCYSSISASACSDVYFKVKDELTDLIKDESDSLRSQGADYIILSLHDGQSGSTSGNVDSMEWYDDTLSDGYVDLVFEAHTHSSYTITDRHGVNHIQAGGYNKGISHASISINTANESSTTSVNIVPYSLYNDQEKDDIIDVLSDLYKNEIGNPDEVLGYNSAKRSSSELADAMAEAYYQLGEEEWGNDFKIVLGGGYIKSRSPYNLAKGDVTVRDLQTLFPFDNTMMLCTVSGRDLWDKFFNTDNNNYHIAYGSYGEQVKATLKSGKGMNDTYYIVVDSYTSDYAYNRLTVVESLGSDIFPRDVLANYLLTNGWLS